MNDRSRILLVDDDEGARKTLTLILRKNGYETVAAATAQEALEKAREGAFNLALLEIRLPDTAGVDLIAHLREVHPQMAVIMITGHASVGTAVQALSRGASGYVTKPVNMDELLALTREALEKQRLAEEKQRAEERIRQQAEDLSLINILNHAANRGDNTQEIIELLCRETKRIFSCTGATVYLLSEDREHLVIQNLPLPQDMVNRIEKLIGIRIPGVRIPLKAGSWYREALQAGKPQMTHDPAVIQRLMAECTENKVLQKLVPQIYRLLNYSSVISVPLLAEGEALGLLDMGRQEPFTDSDLARFAPLAEQVTAILQRIETKARLAQLRRQHELILSSAGEGIFGLDRDGNFTFVNPAATRVLGYQVEELIGRPHHDALHHSRPDGTPYPAQECPIWAAIEDGIIHRVDDEVFWRKDGTSFPVEYTSSPMRDEGGELVGAVVACRDITERKQAESQRDATLEALRASEERYFTLFNNANDLIQIIDPAGKILAVNKKWSATLEYSQEDARDLRVTDIIREDEIPEVSGRLQRVAGGESVRFETVFISKSGKEINVEGSGNGMFKDGKFIATSGIFRDITERKRAEGERELLVAQIREQANRVQQTIDTVPEGVLLLDAEHRVMLANPVAKGDLAVLADAKVGDTLTRLGDRPLAEFLTSPPAKGLWHEVKADGRTFEVIARPMENGPEAENWVLVTRDVTQEREVQRHLRQQERLAAVGQLAAGIAHDFNNIMAVIVLYTQMGLRMPDIPVNLRERLETVARQANRATDLIEQILDFSRRAVLERRPMDLTPFLKEVVKLLERTIAENVRISLNYGTGEYTVNADPTRMQQAIMNLVVNARDAMPEGGELSITVSRVAETDEIRCVTCGQVAGGEWVRIAVTDTGSGIPPEVLPHLFEPFFTTREVGKGTGLGLAQVYGIVKQHEGHIDVSTEVGAGTTFTLYLPALLERPPEASVLETEALVEGQGETILVVEDDATLREALADTLELLNYRVLEAANGREALDILEQHAGEIALVLSDLVMPEMGGQALFHAMQQRGLTLPLVMLSGHPMEHELKSLQAQGLAGWMLKPPSPEQLAQLLARALK